MCKYTCRYSVVSLHIHVVHHTHTLHYSHTTLLTLLTYYTTHTLHTHTHTHTHTHSVPQLTKEVRSIAPFLIPFLKMTCIYFVLWLDQGSFPAAFVKCLPMLSLIWFVCLLGVSDSHVHQYNRKILTALVLCCIGDFSLVWAEEDEKFFMLGMGCFAIAHIVYSHAFGWQPFGLKELVFNLTLGLPITAAILSYIEGPMFYPVLVYGLVLVLMMWRALAR